MNIDGIDMNMSDAMLPVGQTALRKLEVVKVAITMDLCHSIVSIAHDQPNYVATKADDVDFLLQCASAGYLYMYVVVLLFQSCVIGSIARKSI